MKNQKRTIMGACEFCIATLQKAKQDLLNMEGKNKEITWALIGVVVTLTANLLHTCHSIFTDGAKNDPPDVKADLLKVQQSFNDFMTKMINHE